MKKPIPIYLTQKQRQAVLSIDVDRLPFNIRDLIREVLEKVKAYDDGYKNYRKKQDQDQTRSMVSVWKDPTINVHGLSYDKVRNLIRLNPGKSFKEVLR